MNKPKFKAGDYLVAIDNPNKKRFVVEVQDYDYVVKSLKRPGGLNFTLGIEYIEDTYELDIISDSPLMKALR